MRVIPLQATATHYRLEIDRTTLTEGPAVLAENNQPVAVLLPLAEYQAFQQWQRRRQAAEPPLPSDFAAEVAAFERLKPTLQAAYGDQVVAIHQGRVVASGDDKMDVLGQVLDVYGPVSCYIEWVEAETPRRVRIPSVRVKR